MTHAPSYPYVVLYSEAVTSADGYPYHVISHSEYTGALSIGAIVMHDTTDYDVPVIVLMGGSTHKVYEGTLDECIEFIEDVTGGYDGTP